MPRKLMTLTVIVLLTSMLIGTNSAQASSKSILHAKYQKQKRWMHKSQSVVRFWKNHPKVYAAHWRFASKNVRAHRERIEWLKSRIEHTRRLLTAPRIHVRNVSAWLCIHSHEGAWNANTGNGYYGGLQMDMGFQRTYGSDLLNSKGTANNWTPLEQMMVAQRAYDSGRGFGPWPNTARYCGLL